MPSDDVCVGYCTNDAARFGVCASKLDWARTAAVANRLWRCARERVRVVAWLWVRGGCSGRCPETTELRRDVDVARPPEHGRTGGRSFPQKDQINGKERRRAPVAVVQRSPARPRLLALSQWRKALPGLEGGEGTAGEEGTLCAFQFQGKDQPPTTASLAYLTLAVNRTV
jgi:hypothetical protein